MRKLFALIAAGALVALAGGTASAAPVSTNVTVSVNIGGVAGFTLTDSGTVSLTGTPAAGDRFFANSATTIVGSQLQVNAGLATLATVQTINVPDSTLVDNVVLQNNLQNGGGTFSLGGVSPGEVCASPVPASTACVSGGGFGGVMPISGTITANLLGSAAKLTVPIQDLQVGQGGTVTGLTVGSALGGPITADVEAGEWTTGVANVATSNIDNLTSASGQGQPVSFVSPTYLNATITALGSNLEIPAFATFTLDGVKVVPEPGTLLLLGTGVAGLALVGRSRRR